MTITRREVDTRYHVRADRCWLCHGLKSVSSWTARIYATAGRPLDRPEKW